MRYIELLENKLDSIALLKNARKVFAGRKDVFWHQTGINAARSILVQGFKTGKELSVGEVCNAIFFTGDFHRQVSYARGEKRTVYIPVVTAGLHIIDNWKAAQMIDLDLEHQTMVDKGIWTPDNAKQYQISRMLDDGDFPVGVDGINMLSEKGHTRRLSLTKNAANKGLQQALDILKQNSP